MKNFEEQQTGDSGMVEELTYTLERMARGEGFPNKQFGRHGLRQEEFVVKTKFIKPMVSKFSMPWGFL